MMRFAISLLFVVSALSFAAAAERPAKGKLLVATDEVRGEVFAETVILLLHYDASGAMGIVINRPTDVELSEVVDDAEAFPGYSDTLYWGGPVQMNSLRALLHADEAPPGSETIIGSVHIVDIDGAPTDPPVDMASVRLFIGYAGWGPRQLDGELARGSWHVVPATDEHVFADDPGTLWKRLSPPRRHLAAERSESSNVADAGRPVGYRIEATSAGLAGH